MSLPLGGIPDLIRRAILLAYPTSRKKRVAADAGCGVDLAKGICATGKVARQRLPHVLDAMERRLEERRAEIDRTLHEIRTLKARGHDHAAVQASFADVGADRAARDVPRGAGDPVLLPQRSARVGGARVGEHVRAVATAGGGD